MITLTMACGHSVKVGDEAEQAVCACGERRVSRVKARAPKFRGLCLGPHATYQALTGIPVTMPKGTDE